MCWLHEYVDRSDECACVDKDRCMLITWITGGVTEE